jgi:hypothetical protein
MSQILNQNHNLIIYTCNNYMKKKYIFLINVFKNSNLIGYNIKKNWHQLS